MSTKHSTEHDKAGLAYYRCDNCDSRSETEPEAVICCNGSVSKFYPTDKTIETAADWDRLKAENAELKKAYSKYAGHLERCAVMNRGSHCNCGVYNILFGHHPPTNESEAE
jgi:hypothetical protein